MSESEGMNIFTVCETDHLIDFPKGCIDSYFYKQAGERQLHSPDSISRSHFNNFISHKSTHLSFVSGFNRTLLPFPTEFTVGYWFIKDILSCLKITLLLLVCYEIVSTRV